MSVLNVFFLYVWGAWVMDGGWMPLPTRPQRYCDPASLVYFLTKTKVSSISFINNRNDERNV